VIYLLDTNTCVGYLNGTADGVLRRLQTIPPHDVAVCAVVKAVVQAISKNSAQQESS
jgi:tRNA(fMet)-specific endonuclease VapC